MKRLAYLAWVLLLTTNSVVCAAAAEETVDLKRGVPPEAYLAVYTKHNPERDFQRAYWQDVFAAVDESQIVQRALKIATSRIPGDDLEQAKAVFEELQAAVEPIDLKELANSKEAVYAQKMDEMTSQHLILVRMTPEAAANYANGVANLFRLAEKYSGGKVPVNLDTDSPAQLTFMALPAEVPFRPAVGHQGDVFVFSSSEDFARKSLDMLFGGGGDSKFDDPRLKEALEQLPAAEDSIVFYDGRQQFAQMRKMFEAISEKAGGDNPEAKTWLGIMGKIFDELTVMDYEITVEYTEDNLNRSATLGKIIPGTEERLLAKLFGSGQPFDQWQRWVPADATRYSLNTGVNLHALYEFVTQFVKENIPDSGEAFERFEAWQDEYDLHIDEDILQAFSGECVSVSVPAEVPTMFSSEHSVMAMRCQKPEGIRKLLHRLVTVLQELPMMEMQQLELTESDELEGFEELSATIFAAFGAKPIIGFHEGWMICGSNAEVVKKVLATRAGESPSIVTTDDFKRFRLDIDGPVKAVSYTDMARSTQQMATMLSQAGAIMPMVIGLVGAEIDPEDLKPVQEIVGLLPSVGKIVGKFDFLEAKLATTQEGDKPGTYVRHSVILVRPPTADAPAEATSDQ